MKLLLDTHALLWALAEPAALSSAAREHIVSPDNSVFVSAVSAWEIEIKRALHKLDAPHDLDAQISAHRFTELPLRVRHTQGLASLPPLHRDPFDRMLIAQALVEELTVVTHDRRFAPYGVPVIWV